MRDRSEVLKKRRSILLLGTFLFVAIPFSGAFAADQAASAVTAAVPEWPKWYFYGGLEAGGRFFSNQPPSGFGRSGPPENWLTPVTTQSRAKFEEYGQIRPGAFLDWINLQAGTTDGRYAYDFWGRSVGINNQSYTFDASEVGRHYLSLGWDQTPHLLSTSAKNIFGGTWTTLTVPNSVQAALQSQLGSAAANSPAGQTARANIENIINNNLGPLELGTQRDKATAAYRYTPTPDWDFGVDYSHEHRTGLRPTGVSWGYATATPADPPSSPRPTNVIEIPQPLNDTTQNVDAKAEYVGTTFSARGGRRTSNIADRSTTTTSNRSTSKTRSASPAVSLAARIAAQISCVGRLPRATTPTPSPRQPQSICRSGRAASSTRFSITPCGRTIRS
jgi:Putative outer membrane beta-barrel porin, MtrB/PioB